MMDGFIYGIHAGRKGEVESLFIESEVVALSLPKVGDLQQFASLSELREAYLEHYANDYRYSSKYAYRVNTGVLYRFSHLINFSDYFVFYSLTKKTYYIGKPKTLYEYRPDIHELYPHQIKVTWLQTTARSDTPKDIQKAMNCGLALFNLSKYQSSIEKMLRNNQ